MGKEEERELEADPATQPWAVRHIFNLNSFIRKQKKN